MAEIINRVAGSGIITLDLGEYYPKAEREAFDLSGQLWQGLVLKEKDFRTFIAENNWERYRNKHVALYCSVDALIPTWAYMLLASALQGIATEVYYGNPEQMESVLWTEVLQKLNPEDFRDARVVVKGCADKPVSPQAFVLISFKLKPVVKSLMFGEPCSTVPVYKQSKS